MQLPSLSFAHPEYWLLLPVAGGLFWWLATRTGGRFAAGRPTQAIIIRCCAAALVIGAMAQPVARWQSRARRVVFVVDESRSISPAARRRELDLVRGAMQAKAASDQVGLVTFAADPVLRIPLSANPGELPTGVSGDDDATDIGSALRLAGGELQANGGQIVLLSDGIQTAQSSGDALGVAAGAGVPVYTVDPAKFLGQSPVEASVTRVDLPVSVHENEPLAIQAVVASSVPQTATLTATADGKQIASQQVSLAAGKTAVALPARISGSGIRQVVVSVDAPRDTLLENNSASALTRVIGKPRILCLSDAPQTIAPTLQRAMRAHSISVDVKSPLESPTDVAGFAAYDSVVLSDIPAGEVSAPQQTALQSAVRDFGVGIGMVGGTSSFIGGGWRGTPVEAALPVTMVPRAGQKLPPADVVIVLDASDSMGADENGVEKVQLAARAAVALLGTLQPVDRVAVIAVTETPTLVLPFASPSSALAARKTIEGVDADGGGIYCHTGLEAAYELLDASHAAIKHVVLCADTSDSEEQQDCVTLAREMRQEERITTSCCGIGDWSDNDVGFQRQVSNAGGGQLYVVSHASDLPKFFQRDVAHIQPPPYEEGSFTARVTEGDPLIAGLGLSSSPPLLGYNLSTARSGANVALRAPGYPDPLLAYENYGLGRSFAFTSDETSHWGARWVPWQGYGAFWSRVLRWSLRRDQPADFQLFADLTPGGNGGKIVVDAFLPDGSYRNDAQFQAVIAAPAAAGSASGVVQRVALAQTAPGRYEASFAAGQVGQYLVSVSRPGDAGGGIATAGVSQPYLAEFAQSAPDVSLLSAMSEQSGGKLIAQASNIWKQPGLQSATDRSIAPLWLLLGAALFLLDVAWRRLGWRLRTRQRAEDVVGHVADTLADNARLLTGAGERIAARRRAAGLRRDQQKADRATDLLSRPIGTRLADNDDDYLRSRTTLGARPAGGISDQEEEAFPLVASLDDARRRNNLR